MYLTAVSGIVSSGNVLADGKKWHHPGGCIPIRGGWRVAGRQTSILALHKQVRRIQSPVCDHSAAGLNGAGMSEAARKPCKGGGPQWRREHHPSISVPLKTKTKRFRETWRDQRQMTGQSSSSWRGQVCGELWRSRERRLRRPAARCGFRGRLRVEGEHDLRGAAGCGGKTSPYATTPPSGDVLVQGPKHQRTAASRWRPCRGPHGPRRRRDRTEDRSRIQLLTCRSGQELSREIINNLYWWCF